MPQDKKPSCKLPILVDAHQDLAWNRMLFGRDCMQSVQATRRNEQYTLIPSAVGDRLTGYPEWVAGGIGLVFATLFVSPARRQAGVWESVVYHDVEEAHKLYLRQLDYYHHVVGDHQEKLIFLRSRHSLRTFLQEHSAGRAASQDRVAILVSMEGADAIRTPAEVEAWYERGVRVIGPAWAGTRYAGGTLEPGPLSPEGRELLARMAELKLILDVSHMSDEALLESLEQYEGTLVATHSNPRKLLPGSAIPERHLSDQAIVGIAERDGVMGIAVYNPFLKDGWTRGDERSAVRLEHVAACIDHICQLTGSARFVGIGSDFDGGYGRDCIPSGLDSIADLRLIGDTLMAWGYSCKDVAAIMGMNWVNLLLRALP